MCHCRIGKHTNLSEYSTEFSEFFGLILLQISSGTKNGH